jgi:stage V sporulation protein S
MDAVVLKVSSKSNPNLVAGALTGTIRESGRAELFAIGAGAINQAVKAVAITRNVLTEADLICIPSFVDLTIDDQIRTSIKLIVEPRQPTA